MPGSNGPKGAPPRFVGFYWTLPVPRVGFTRLPEGADEAAAASRTIRYQRDVVRAFVKECGGELAGEVVWLELEPDRGSSYVDAALEKAFAICRAEDAGVLYVDFAECSGWRAHHHLRHRLETAHAPCRGLDPEPLPGDPFDPIRHFRAWRDALEDLKASQPRGAALQRLVLSVIAPCLPPEATPPDYQSAAALLADRDIRTTTGRQWTADNLRMFVRKATGSRGA